ncbi:MAG: DNA-directed RNA polymerase subunit alpha, partial [Anaerolineae bacterium]|nr:DNA-directed RNA polymerase subunit alpha [Anaerolineae bacterium]
DIEAPADIEIVNPELPLLTLDTLDSDLEMELVAEKGVGYSPAEDRKSLPIGQIPVDAIFSPIVKVNHTVESTRIEQLTNCDMLKFEIWTDGTVRPGDALQQAAEAIVRHFTPIAGFVEEEVPEVEAEPKPLGDRYYNVPIEDLELAMRAYNCLKRASITSVGDILDRLDRGGTAEMLAIRNFGQKSLEELLERMEAKGFLPEGLDLDKS